MIHELKILPTYFNAKNEGAKSWELRVNDRDFKIGDSMRLREYTTLGGYTGREMTVLIEWMFDCGAGSLILSDDSAKQYHLKVIKTDHEN